jgi:hypothetical protein
MKSMTLPSASPSFNHVEGVGELDLDDFMNNDDDPFEDKALITVSSSAAASEAEVSKSPLTVIAGAASPKGEVGGKVPDVAMFVIICHSYCIYSVDRKGMVLNPSRPHPSFIPF